MVLSVKKHGPDNLRSSKPVGKMKVYDHAKYMKNVSRLVPYEYVRFYYWHICRMMLSWSTFIGWGYALILLPRVKLSFYGLGLSSTGLGVLNTYLQWLAFSLCFPYYCFFDFFCIFFSQF